MTGRISATCLGALMMSASPASAAVIFSDNFNAYRGTPVGQQPGTGRLVYTNGTLPGWVNSAGNGSLNAVDRGNGDYAIMFYDRNVMFYGTPIAANERGKTYTVTFESSIAASSNAAQVTGPQSYAAFVINGVEGNIATFEFRPDLTTTAFLTRSFTYTGTGSGGIYLNIVDGGSDDGRYGAAVDNVSVTDAPAVPEPASWAMMIVGLGAAGATMRRRRGAATRVAAA